MIVISPPLFTLFACTSDHSTHTVYTAHILYTYIHTVYKRNVLSAFSGACVCNSYPCEWGGVVNGNPYLKNLDEFGKTVLEDLWRAVVEQFVEVSNLPIQIL